MNKQVKRYVLTKEGKWKEKFVPYEEALKHIKNRLRKDREMLEILAKL